MTFYICNESGCVMRQSANMLSVGDVVTVNGRDRIVTCETGTIWMRYYYTKAC